MLYDIRSYYRNSKIYASHVSNGLEVSVYFLCQWNETSFSGTSAGSREGGLTPFNMHMNNLIEESITLIKQSKYSEITKFILIKKTANIATMVFNFFPLF